MKSSIQKIFMIFLGIVLALLLLELVLRIYFLLYPQPRITANPYSIVRDSDLGFKLKLDDRFKAERFLESGEKCYSAEYNTDSRGRRTVSVVMPGIAEKHLLLFGNSFVFGEGLADPDTLHYHLSKLLKDTSIYNYAVHGWGPNHTLALLKNRDLRSEVQPLKGDGLLIVIGHDIFRVLGSTHAPWIYDGPYFYLKDGALMRDGSFRSGRAQTTRLYEWVVWFKTNSEIIKLLDPNLPWRLKPEHLKLYSAVLKEIEKEYRKQFGGRLTVVFYPSAFEYDGSYINIIAADLAGSGVSVLNLTDYPYSEKDMLAPGCDPHPSGELNKLMAQKISDFIR